MKRCILMSMVLGAMFLPAFAVGREFEPPEAEWQMELREREMELQQRETKMDFERRMRELDLENRKIEMEHLRKGHKDGALPLLLLIAVVHILCAVWVYQDIRRREHGSGIWIVIALLTGLLGTLVYAVVRLGNTEKKKA